MFWRTSAGAAFESCRGRNLGSEPSKASVEGFELLKLLKGA